MLNIAKAITMVTPEIANGTTQITTVADMTVVAFIHAVQPDKESGTSVALVVLVEGTGMSPVTYCWKKQYDAAMKLLTECDIGNEDEYLEAEHAQPTDKDFRWIP